MPEALERLNRLEVALSEAKGDNARARKRIEQIEAEMELMRAVLSSASRTTEGESE